MTTPIQLNARGRRILIPGQALPGFDASPWKGFPVDARVYAARGETGPQQIPSALLTYRLAGRGRLRLRDGVYVRTLDVPTRSFLLSGAGAATDNLAWDGEQSETLFVEFRPGDFQRDFLEDLPALDGALFADDALAESLVLSIKAEVETGSPNGRLFAEGLSLALLGRILSRHAGRVPRCVVGNGGLSTVQVARVKSFVHEHLEDDIGLLDMAGLLAMSRAQFARLFRMSTGLTPYAYLQSARIARAKELLRGPTPIAQIATLVGYSSQAHFSYAFKRITGMTPGRYRRD